MRHHQTQEKKKMTEQTKPESPSAPLEKAAADGVISLEKRIETVITEYVNKAVGDLEKKIDTMIDTQFKAKEIEVEQALRKGLGIENDPVIHRSDLASALRKASLENVEKRSPAAAEKAAPEGNKTSDPLDEAFKQYGV